MYNDVLGTKGETVRKNNGRKMLDVYLIYNLATLLFITNIYTDILEKLRVGGRSLIYWLTKITEL